MITETSKTASAAVEHFLGRTAMRRSAQRNAYVEMIRTSPRPMALAIKLLARGGIKTVTAKALKEAIVDLQAARGPFDPVFRECVKEALERAGKGDWTVPDHEALMGILRASWRPYAEADHRVGREAAQAMREARRR